MINKNLLLELLTEDLPYKKSHLLIICFVKHFISQISHLKYFYKKVEWEVTHRRIVLKIYNLHKLSKKNLSFFKKTNNSTKFEKNKKLHLEKILNNILVNTLKRCNVFQKGLIIHQELNNKITFIRPIKNLIIILNQNLIKINFLNLKSNRYTFSNIFIKKNRKIKIDNFNNYDSLLYKRGKIIINYKHRKYIILKQLKELEIIKGITIDYESLIEESIFLKEWPVVLQSSFKKRFLHLPQELLIYFIKKQKCFPVFRKDNNNILPIFLTVINIPLTSFNKDIISKGFSNNLNNLLTEIEFFFLKDRKKTLFHYLEDLKNISFELKLGNFFHKTQRIKLILVWLAQKFNLNKEKAKHIAILSKCDFATLLVKEYPELRGVIGMCYSKLDNEDNEVSIALKSQYLHLNTYQSQSYPKLYCYLSLANKLDDLVALVSIHFDDKKIYLEQDPYEIRRKTISLIKTILFYNLNIDLFEIIKQIKMAYKDINAFVKIDSQKIFNFIYLKYISWARRNFSNPLLIKSVTNIYANKQNIFLLNKRIELLHKYFNTPYLNKTLEIYKRITNLLYKLDLDKFSNNIKINPKLLIDPLEKELFDVILTCKNLFNKIYNSHLQDKIILYMYKLSINMEKFLNNIKIFINNVVISNNRIYISIAVKNLILTLADFNIMFKK